MWILRIRIQQEGLCFSIARREGNARTRIYSPLIFIASDSNFLIWPVSFDFSSVGHNADSRNTRVSDNGANPCCQGVDLSESLAFPIWPICIDSNIVLAVLALVFI